MAGNLRPERAMKEDLLGRERHRNRGVDRVSWTSASGLVAAATEGGRLVPANSEARCSRPIITGK